MTKNVIIHGRSRDHIPKIHTPINCVITDPPFGIDVKMNSAQSPDQQAVNARIENDLTVAQAIQIFYEEMGPILAKLAPHSDLYIFTGWQVIEEWIPAIRRLPWLQPDGQLRELWYNPLYPDIEYKMWGIWDKGYPGKGDLEACWGPGFEPIIYVKKGRRPLSDKRRTLILHVDKVPAGQNIHPTEKPVQLLEKLILMSTNVGDLVVDPFSGSGSTSVAAQKLSRDSLAFEIDNAPPRSFVDKSRERLRSPGLGLI